MEPVPTPAAAWLSRLRHDLAKPLLWPARDRREMGGAPSPGELVPKVIDGEGRPISAADLWASLRAEAPRGLATGAFDAALARALAAAEAGDVTGVLTLQAALDDLSNLVRNLEGTR